MNQKYEQSGVDNRILKADIEALRANVSQLFNLCYDSATRTFLIVSLCLVLER